MKKALSVAFLALFALILSTTAFATTLEVQGDATIYLQADYATLSVGVQSVNASLQIAQQENATKMNALIDALLQAGISKEDIQTNDFNVYQTGDYNPYSSKNNEESFYRISNMLNVTLRDLDTVGETLDLAMQSGANVMNGLSFSSTQQQSAYDRALVKAVENANEKATILASAVGKIPGVIVNMQMSHSYGGGMKNYSMADGVAMEASPIVAGDVSVNAGVTIVYELADPLAE